MAANLEPWEVAEPNEQPPRPWRVDPEGFRRRVHQRYMQAWWREFWWGLLGVVVFIALLVLGRFALGQVPAQDMRSARTWESFDKAHRDVYGTGRTVKPGLRAYYVPGSAKSYITTKGVEPKSGKVVDKRVVFINRQQALEWGRVNNERLIFTPLGAQLPKRIQKEGR